MEENVKFYLVFVILTNVAHGCTATFTRPLWVPHFTDISIACPLGSITKVTSTRMTGAIQVNFIHHTFRG
jgi:hypothetical protein